MKRSIHIEAPVEKVFDIVKGPKYVPGGMTSPFEIKDVKLTAEGLGTSYSWASKTHRPRFEGFDVYTEFIPSASRTDLHRASLTTP